MFLLQSTRDQGGEDFQQRCLQPKTQDLIKPRKTGGEQLVKKKITVAQKTHNLENQLTWYVQFGFVLA